MYDTNNSKKNLPLCHGLMEILKELGVVLVYTKINFTSNKKGNLSMFQNLIIFEKSKRV